MAELILTEGEKKAASYLEWSDEALGKAVKKLAVNMRDKMGDESAYSISCATFLCCQVAEKGHSKGVFALEGVSDNEAQHGNWTITIEKSINNLSKKENVNG